jgi:hypothetical protein
MSSSCATSSSTTDVLEQRPPMVTQIYYAVNCPEKLVKKPFIIIEFLHGYHQEEFEKGDLRKKIIDRDGITSKNKMTRTRTSDKTL